MGISIVNATVALQCLPEEAEAPSPKKNLVTATSVPSGPESSSSSIEAQRALPPPVPKIVHNVCFNFNESLQDTRSLPNYNGTRDLTIPTFFADNMAHIEATNPGWKVRVYDLEDMRAFLTEHRALLNQLLFEEDKEDASAESASAAGTSCPTNDVLALFLRLNSWYGALVADFFRYLILLVEGGVYMDAKSSLFPGCTFSDLFDQYAGEESCFLSFYTGHVEDKYKHASPAGMDMQRLEADFGITGLKDLGVEKCEEISQYFMATTARHPLMREIARRIMRRVQE